MKRRLRKKANNAKIENVKKKMQMRKMLPKAMQGNAEVAFLSGEATTKQR